MADTDGKPKAQPTNDPGGSGHTVRDEATANPGLPALSGREREVAVLVAQGHTNQQIARALSLSIKTVETYLSRLFTKLGVRSRAAVAGIITRQRIPP